MISNTTRIFPVLTGFVTIRSYVDPSTLTAIAMHRCVSRKRAGTRTGHGSDLLFAVLLFPVFCPLVDFPKIVREPPMTMAGAPAGVGSRPACPFRARLPKRRYRSNESHQSTCPSPPNITISAPRHATHHGPKPRDIPLDLCVFTPFQGFSRRTPSKVGKKTNVQYEKITSRSVR